MRYNFLSIETINKKIFMNHKCDVWLYGLKFEVSYLNFWRVKLYIWSFTTQNLKFWSSFWTAKNFIFKIIECLLEMLYIAAIYHIQFIFLFFLFYFLLEIQQFLDLVLHSRSSPFCYLTHVCVSSPSTNYLHFHPNILKTKNKYKKYSLLGLNTTLILWQLKNSGKFTN